MALILLVLISLHEGPAAPSLSAIATWTEGTITVGQQGGTGVAPVVRILRPRERVAAGEIVSVPKKGKAVLICSTDQWVSVSGRREWVLSHETCERGTPIPAGSYRELAAEGGRIRSVATGLAIEIETRTGAEEEIVPIVLAPRNTAVVEGRPNAIWTRVPRAMEYEIQWLGTSSPPVRIAAEKARCSAGKGAFQGLEICSAPYPADRPQLSPGERVFLSIGCRLRIASAWRRERDAAMLRLLTSAEQDALRQRLEAVHAVPAEPDTRLLLVAGAYAAGGALHEAWQRYSLSKTPAAWITAGDLAFEMDLLALAVREYRRALDRNPALNVRAAAELGLGRVAFAHRSYAQAHAHFERAMQGFAASSLEIEEAEARAAWERTAARMREQESQ